MSNLKALSISLLLAIVNWPSNVEAQNNILDCMSLTGVNLYCISTQTCLDSYSQICDGFPDCFTLSEDEGGLLNPGFRDSCSTFGLYQCQQTGTLLDVNFLCNGYNDCGTTDGDDERNTLCDDKCLQPYYGGCDPSRLCENIGTDRRCANCLDGYYDRDGNESPCPYVPANITWNQDIYSVSENSLNAQICLTLEVLVADLLDINQMSVTDSLGDRNITVDITSADSTAINGVNFMFDSPQQVVFTDTNRTACVSVTIVGQPMVVTGDLQFSLLIGQPRVNNLYGIEASVTGAGIATVSILDQNPLTLVGSVMDLQVGEAAGLVELCYTVMDNVAYLSPVRVTLEMVPLVNPDAAFVDQSVNITLELLTAFIGDLLCFNVSIIDDVVVERSEAYVLSVSSSATFYQAPERATLSILDNDRTMLSLIVPNGNGSRTLSGVEGQNVTLLVQLEGQLAPGLIISTSLAVLQGSASDMDGDYTVLQGTAVTFGYVPMTSVQTQEFSIYLIADTLLEGDESFSVALGNDTVLITIQDATVGTVSTTEAVFTSTMGLAPQVMENTVTIGLSLDVGTQIALTYQLIWIDGSIITLNFAPSAGSQSAQAVLRLAADGAVDFVLNITRSLVLLPTGQNGLSILPEVSVSIVMYDPDVIFVRSMQRSFDLRESSGTQYLQFAYNGVIGGDYQNYSINGLAYLSFDVAIIPETAYVPSDVDGSNQTYSFHFGNPQPIGGSNFSFTIIDDQVVESTERFSIAISSETNYIYLDTTSVNVSLTDNDVAMFSLIVPNGNGSNTLSGAEGQNVTLLVQLNGQLFEGQSMSASLILIPGSASDMDGDYSALGGTSFTFGYVPMTSVQTQELSIYLTADNLLEGEESFSVALGNETVLITIQDATVGTVSTTEAVFTSTMGLVPQVMENTVTIGLSLDVGTQIALTYQLIWIDGSTVEFNFAPSAGSQSAQSVLRLAADGAVDFVLNITRSLVLLPTGQNGLSVSTEVPISIMMYDPDVISVRSMQRSFNLRESSGTQYLQFDYNGIIGGAYQDYSVNGLIYLSFDVAIIPETAYVPSDVRGSNQTYSFHLEVPQPIGGNNFTFAIVEDQVVEYDETFQIVISTTTDYIYLGLTTVNVSIADDDVLSISFATPNATVSEDEGTVKMFFNVNPLLTEIPIGFIVSIIQGTATLMVDYNVSSPVVPITVLPGINASYYVEATINNDDILEISEYFQVGINIASDSSSFAVIEGPTISNVVIADDSPDTEVALRVGSRAFNGSVYFSEDRPIDGVITYLMANELGTTISFIATVIGDTATFDRDYILSQFEVSFSPGNLMQVVPISILDDNLTERVESFNVTFAPSQPEVTIEMGAQTQLFIMSNDVSEVSIQAMVDITEGEMLTIPISISGLADSLDIFEGLIYLAAVPESATEDDYYVSEVGPVQINRLGELVSEINVTALRDNILEGSESFILNMTVADVPYLELGEGSSAFVYIEQYPGFRPNATLEFESETGFMFSETAGEVYINVTLALTDAVLDTMLTFEVTFANGSAFSGIHYTYDASTVIFGPEDQLTQQISFELFADDDSSTSRYFTISLSPIDDSVTVIGDSSVIITKVNVDDPCSFEPCDENADCTSDGATNFTCVCQPGYSGDGFECEDIDECATEMDNCDIFADCENTDGSFTCTCVAGYSGNGTKCFDIDECAMEIDTCDDYAECDNTPGNFTCMCNEGFSGDGFNCEDIDECTTEMDNCDSFADCENTDGSFTCTCVAGYSGNGTECLDIDECAMEIDTCDYYAECGNTPGNFTCMCNEGFSGDGFNCEDIDECALGTDNCDPMAAECTNTIGNFTCACMRGYMGDGVTCTGIMFGDDPHFSVVLPSNKMLCFSVMGQHGLSYNLISNPKISMNAIFAPDSRREEVTWIGSLGVVAKNASDKHAHTKLKFLSKPRPKIVFNDGKASLSPKNIEKIVFKDGRVMISEAKPTIGFKYPSVFVVIEDLGLKFTIKFMNEHLDMFWHSTAQQQTDSHGLIGQFFREGVEIDEIRKILIMPNKEPVPVMRRPVWAFMEREEKDDQLCWTAMNAGYQGEGLIDGKYSHYQVKDVLADDFVYKNIL